MAAIVRWFPVSDIPLTTDKVVYRRSFDYSIVCSTYYDGYVVLPLNWTLS